MQVHEPMEMAFAIPILNKFDNFYSICDNHREHCRHSRTNKYPFVRLSLQEQLWDLNLPNQEHDLVQRVMDRTWVEFHECYQSQDAEDENGFRICFDLNGYRLIALLPIYDLWDERNELEEGLEYDQDQVEREDDIERIKEIDEELIDCAKKLLFFEKVVRWVTSSPH